MMFTTVLGTVLGNVVGVLQRRLFQGQSPSCERRRVVCMHCAHCLAPEASVSSSFRPLPLLIHSDHFAARITPQAATTILPSCRQGHGFLSHSKTKTKTETRMSASAKGSFEPSMCLDLSHSQSQCHFSSLQFSSRWYIYALGKAHKLYAPPRLSEIFPNVAFETVPMLSVLLRFVSAMVWYVITSHNQSRRHRVSSLPWFGTS